MAVRFEKVIVDLDDRFTRPMAGMAASTAVFRKNVEGAGRDLDVFGRNADKNTRSIDQFSGRLRLLADVAAVLGPALAPIGAMAVPAVAGLAAQFGFAAVGAGTALAAFQGVGDALKAVNTAALEPTSENLAKAEDAMNAISPAARSLVGELRELQPVLRGLRDTAAEGMFPGLIDGIDALEGALPRVNRILEAVSGELGNIARDTGESLASDRWAPFLDFIATEAPPALSDLAAALGNITHGMAEMWMAFDPVNDDFSGWLVEVTRDFDQWAAGLAQTEGFENFVDYLRTAGPQVAETMGALGNALVQVLQAAAPIGGPVLKGIEAFADAISAIADSDLGTPIFAAVAAMSALNLAMRTASSLSLTAFGGPALAAMRTQGSTLKGLRADWAAYSAVQRTAAGRAQASAGAMIAHRDAATRLGASLRSTAATMGKAGAAVGGLAIASSGAADGMGLTNTASLALMGTLAGPWGAAIGGGIGLTMDLANANNDLEAAITRAQAAMRADDVAAMEAAHRDLGERIRENNRLSSGMAPGGYFEKLRAHIENLTGSSDDARRAHSDLEAQLARTRAQAARNAPYLAMARSIVRNQEAARKTAGEFITLGDSLNDAKVSLNGWIREMARNARALQNFGNNARRAADKGLRQGLIKALQEAGPEGARRMAQLANATQEQIGRANRAWGAGRRATRNYIDTVNQVPRDKATLLKILGAAKSKGEVLSVIRQLDNLPRSRTTDIFINTVRTTHFRTVRSGLTHGKPDMLRADGGFISGPGGPRDDAIPAWLSNGEFVVNAAATRRYRAELEAMNAQKFADGGHVSPRVSVAAPAVSVGGNSIRVFVGDREVNAIVDERIADHMETQNLRSRTRG